MYCTMSAEGLAEVIALIKTSGQPFIVTSIAHQVILTKRPRALEGSVLGGETLIKAGDLYLLAPRIGEVVVRQLFGKCL